MIFALAKNYKTTTIVLKNELDENSANKMVEDKKTDVFRKFLKKPKKDEVSIDSLKLLYEAVLIISGKYVADFYRKATKTIEVDSNVKEVILGEGKFLVKSKKGLLKLGGGKNKVDLNLEEHVFLDEEDKITFDHHGNEIKFPFKINSKTIENYPTKILEIFVDNIKKPEISNDAAVEKFQSKLKEGISAQVRDLKEELTINEISEVYIPIYEARLIGPKKKVELLRIDAVRKKIL